MNAVRDLPFDHRVADAARSVIRQHALRKSDAAHALLEWERLPTLSNALRRDDAALEVESLELAAIVARALLERHADELVAYYNSLPEGVSSEAMAEATNIRRELRDAA